ncbi:hypothetical protein M9H77_20715 [Catharanthus roseus]|uniref:Uncharacterized protein n=1 Tax=Catharanthus roseus TaxID=4058 RepID=A0ACC0AKA5_CATRO|nr:hypothetical protein M9H77_20715 [Catharanthus roseus]
MAAADLRVANHASFCPAVSSAIFLYDPQERKKRRKSIKRRYPLGRANISFFDLPMRQGIEMVAKILQDAMDSFSLIEVGFAKDNTMINKIVSGAGQVIRGYKIFLPFTRRLGGGRSSCGNGKGRSHQGTVKYGFSLIKGKANHPMEDYHVAKFVQFQGRELGLFAIYDGHLGDSVPAYLQKHLFQNILKEEEFWTDPNRSISKAYERTDQAILSHNPDLGRGGSTAVTAILINASELWVANVGDSRAILSKRGQAIQMTIDHEPNTERGSIEDRGGFVSNMPGAVSLMFSLRSLVLYIQRALSIKVSLDPGDVARVNGQLAVSRAFGDKNLKSHLRSDPDVTNANIDNSTELLILASDGLWKVMSNQEAVDIARKTRDPQKAAKQLAMEAVHRESKDDISCIVVRFRV